MLRKITVSVAFALCLSTSTACEIALAAPDDAGVVVDAAPPITVDPTTGTVTPAPGTLPDRVTSDPIGFATQVIEAIRGGGWRILAASILAAIMVLGIRFNVRVFGTTDRGKSVAVMVLSLLGAGSAALADVAELSFGLALGAVTIAWTAVGGRQWISRFLWPQDGGAQWMVWFKPLLGVK